MAPSRVAMAQRPTQSNDQQCHGWGREIGRRDHKVRLIPPAYVRPFVKRQKSNLVEAEAICEAAQRPTMPFVALKSEAAQAAAVILRTRDLLVRQRRQRAVIYPNSGRCCCKRPAMSAT